MAKETKEGLSVETERPEDENRNRICCFTGHRVIPEAKQPVIERDLEKALVKLIKQGVIYYENGGALGFDTIAAKTVIRLREQYPHVKLILVLPCSNQADYWSDRDRQVYQEIKEQADEVVYTSEHYYRGCMHKRNRYLVDTSGVCVCYLKENKGGTAYTVGYAKKNGVQVINIAE